MDPTPTLLSELDKNVEKVADLADEAVSRLHTPLLGLLIGDVRPIVVWKMLYLSHTCPDLEEGCTMLSVVTDYTCHTPSLLEAPQGHKDTHSPSRLVRVLGESWCVMLPKAKKGLTTDAFLKFTLTLGRCFTTLSTYNLQAGLASAVRVSADLRAPETDGPEPALKSSAVDFPIIALISSTKMRKIRPQTNRRRGLVRMTGPIVPPVNQIVKTSVHQTIDTPVHQTIDTPVHQTLDTPGHQTLNTPVHQTPNTPVHQTPNTPVHQTTNTPVHQTINTPVHQTLDTPVHQTPNTPVHQTTNTPVHQTTNTPVHQTINTPVHQTINTPVHLNTPVHQNTLATPGRQIFNTPDIQITNRPEQHVPNTQGHQISRQIFGTLTLQIPCTPERPTTCTPERPTNCTPVQQTIGTPVQQTLGSPTRQTLGTPTSKNATPGLKSIGLSGSSSRSTVTPTQRRLIHAELMRLRLLRSSPAMPLHSTFHKNQSQSLSQLQASVHRASTESSLHPVDKRVMKELYF